MALDFTALQAEVAARGFDYLTLAGGGAAADVVRLKRFINDAMHEVDAAEKWDYTYASSSGALPLTIADLRLVEDVFVTNVDTPLIAQSRAMLENVYGNLTLASVAAPRFWYRSAPTVVSAYPFSVTFALNVRYWKFGPDLSAGADVPLMPDRWRQVIVEKAAAKAFRDSSNVNAANDCLAESQRLLDEMRVELLPDYMIAQRAMAAAQGAKK